MFGIANPVGPLQIYVVDPMSRVLFCVIGGLVVVP
jgi:hypothetical protein